MQANAFDRLESEVRSYSRSFPAIFAQACGSWMTDEQGRRYLDFFAGAGSLNYGHNHPVLKQALLDYIARDGIVHGLDMATCAKRTFMETFERLVLVPRGLEYKLQFTGPTGTNAVEAALKLARQVKGRSNVVCFTNAFHGVTAGAPLAHTTFMPYAGYFGRDADTLGMLHKQLSDPSSGLDRPAAVLVETIQGEGGINTASATWLRGLEALCRKHDMLLIVDDIQMGCGRTGTFFSFEEAGLSPDIVTLSKSLSGYGLPMSLVLLKPELDIWKPAAHNGTFRGNNAAFITATKALETFWADDGFAREVQARGDFMHLRLRQLMRRSRIVRDVRGRGMVAGLVMKDTALADAVSERCFQRGLIIETCGPQGEVVKLLPPLTIEQSALEEGLTLLADVVQEIAAEQEPAFAREGAA